MIEPPGLTMTDLLYIHGTIGFFATSLGYGRASERLGRRSDDEHA